jgi:hypothetical protein
VAIREPILTQRRSDHSRSEQLEPPFRVIPTAPLSARFSIGPTIFEKNLGSALKSRNRLFIKSFHHNRSSELCVAYVPSLAIGVPGKSSGEAAWHSSRKYQVRSLRGRNRKRANSGATSSATTHYKTESGRGLIIKTPAGFVTTTGVDSTPVEARISSPRSQVKSLRRSRLLCLHSTVHFIAICNALYKEALDRFYKRSSPLIKAEIWARYVFGGDQVVHLPVSITPQEKCLAVPGKSREHGTSRQGIARLLAASCFGNPPH